GSDEHHDELSDAEREWESKSSGDDGMVPVQPEQPGNVQRHVRIESAAERRSVAGERHIRPAVLAGDLRAIERDNVLLLRNRSEHGRNGVWDGVVADDGRSAGGNDGSGDRSNADNGNAERVRESQRSQRGGMVSV